MLLIDSLSGFKVAESLIIDILLLKQTSYRLV